MPTSHIIATTGLLDFTLESAFDLDGWKRDLAYLETFTKDNAALGNATANLLNVHPSVGTTFINASGLSLIFVSNDYCDTKLFIAPPRPGTLEFDFASRHLTTIRLNLIGPASGINCSPEANPDFVQRVDPLEYLDTFFASTDPKSLRAEILGVDRTCGYFRTRSVFSVVADASALAGLVSLMISLLYLIYNMCPFSGSPSSNEDKKNILDP